MKHKLVEIIKGRTAKFTHFQDGKLYYEIQLPDGKYSFSVNTLDTNDIGSAKFLAKDKAMMFLRYINKAIKSEEIRFTPE